MLLFITILLQILQVTFNYIFLYYFQVQDRKQLLRLELYSVGPNVWWHFASN